MPSPADLALRALALRKLSDLVKRADAEVRREIETSYDVKDRKVLHVDGIEVGHVRLDPGAVTASVVDPAAFQEWVADNHPTEIQEVTTTRVRPTYATAVLAACKARGAACDDEGVMIPGVDVRQGDPVTKVVPSKVTGAAEALNREVARLMRSTAAQLMPGREAK